MLSKAEGWSLGGGPGTGEASQLSMKQGTKEGTWNISSRKRASPEPRGQARDGNAGDGAPPAKCTDSESNSRRENK